MRKWRVRLSLLIMKDGMPAIEETKDEINQCR